MSEERPKSVAKRSGDVSGVGLRVLDALAAHTRFPWPLLKAQCQQRGLDPATLSADAVRDMLDDLLDALARLTDVATAARARKAIEDALER